MEYISKNMYYYDMNVSPENIRINSVLLTHCDSRWSWNAYAGLFRDFDLWYVCSGRGWMKIAGRSTDVSGGDALLLRPGVDYYGTHDVDMPLVVIAVHFDFLDSRRRPAMPEDSLLEPVCRSVKDAHFFETLLRRINELYNSGQAKTAAGYFAVVLQEFFSSAGPQVSPSPQAERIEKICGAILAQPGRRYCVAELAKKTGYSVDHFSRVFKAVKGMSPGEFVIACRIQAARAFLKNSSHSVAYIAEMLGYSDQFFFCKQFRRMTGLSPREFRKR